jgi:hypothetical protein
MSVTDCETCICETSYGWNIVSCFAIRVTDPEPKIKGFVATIYEERTSSPAKPNRRRHIQTCCNCAAGPASGIHATQGPQVQAEKKEYGTLYRMQFQGVLLLCMTLPALTTCQMRQVAFVDLNGIQSPAYPLTACRKGFPSARGLQRRLKNQLQVSKLCSMEAVLEVPDG